MISLQSTKGFSLGRILITATAEERLEPQTVRQALTRHASGDWGNLRPDDVRQNERALLDGDRLFSSYTADEVTRFYIITEGDRSATIVLLPEDC